MNHNRIKRGGMKSKWMKILIWSAFLWIGLVFSVPALAAVSVTLSPASGTVPLTVSCLCDISTDSPVPFADTEIESYNWIFGDGSSKIEGAFIEEHTFTELGTFTVVCIVKYVDGTSESGNSKVEVLPVSDALIQSLIANPSSGTAPLKITADCLVYYPSDIVSYTWDFGDGVTETGTASLTNHTYDLPGTYELRCTVVNSQGKTESKSTTITVSDEVKLVKSLTANPSSGTAPLQVVFTCEPEFGISITSLEWSFGDGVTLTNTSLMQEHTYTLVGEFEVVCQVTDSLGRTERVVVNVVVNSDPVELIKTLTANPSSGEVPLTTTLSCQAFVPSSITKYAWDFGDGTFNADGDASLTHTYHQIGTYAATCTVTDSSGRTETKSVAIEVSSLPQSLIRSLSANPSTGSAPLKSSIVCEVYSQENISSYTWDYGDGSSEATTTGSVSHTFTQVGTYAVRCTVVSTQGQSESRTVSVVVNSDPPSLIESLTANPDSGYPPLTVTLTCNTYNPSAVAKYDWDFGDGSSTLDGAYIESHEFTLPGTFTVICTVYDSENRHESRSVVVQVGSGSYTVEGKWHAFGSELQASGSLQKMYYGIWNISSNGDLYSSGITYADMSQTKGVRGNLYLESGNVLGYWGTSADNVATKAGVISRANNLIQFTGDFTSSSSGLVTHTEDVVLIKDGGTFTQPDLTGTWHYFLWDLGAGVRSSDAGFVKFENTGAILSGTRWNSGASVLNTDGSITDGWFVEDSGGSRTISYAKMTSDKNVIAMVTNGYSSAGIRTFGFMMLLKSSDGDFSQAGLAQNWYDFDFRGNSVNGSSYAYGKLEFDLTGALTEGKRKSVLSSLGCAAYSSGTLALASNGQITGSFARDDSVAEEVLYGRMAPGQMLAMLHTKDSTGTAIDTMILPVNGWVPPDLTCTDTNSTDTNSTSSGGGGGGGCTVGQAGSSGYEWLLLLAIFGWTGMFRLVRRFKHRNLSC